MQRLVFGGACREATRLLSRATGDRQGLVGSMALLAQRMATTSPPAASSTHTTVRWSSLGSAFRQASGSPSGTSRAHHHQQQQPQQAGRSLLGTAAGLTLFALSGSVLVWPLSDLALAPKLVKHAIEKRPAGPEQRKRTSPGGDATAGAARGVLQSYSGGSSGSKDELLMGYDGGDARIVVCSGVSGETRAALLQELAEDEVPVVYLSLREATSAHDLLMSTIKHMYPESSLGALGTACQSMGVWWLVLWDMLLGQDPSMMRSMNFSIVLGHLHRGIALLEKQRRQQQQQRPLPPGAPPAHSDAKRRPVILVDHFDDVVLHGIGAADSVSPTSDQLVMRAMLRRLAAFAATVSLDEGLADVIVLTSLDQPRWRRPYWWWGHSNGRLRMDVMNTEGAWSRWVQSRLSPLVGRVNVQH